MTQAAAVSSADREALAQDVRATLMPGFQGFTVPQWIEEAFASGMMSACVYGSNVRDLEQLTALGRALSDAAPHSLIAIDEEGGEVTRLSYLEGSPTRAQQSWAASMTWATPKRSAAESPRRCSPPGSTSCSHPMPM